MSEFLTSTWLFDSLLVTSLLMAAILVIRRPVARFCGAGVAYALWLIPAARLLMPSLEGAAVPTGDSGQAVRDSVRESILAGVSSGEPAAIAVATGPGIDFAAIVIALWLGGAALFFIIQMIRYASMRDDLLSEAQEIAVIDRVRVVMSDQVAGPLAFGLFKRYIAVPQDFSKAYSPAERELAIAHEMAHHKSGDLFANLAAFIVLCLQWFNPLAWASWNAFRFDQEAACDARVLAGKDAAEREIYGRALARTAFDGVPTFATALNSPKTIIERLRRLTMKDASKQRRSFGKIAILAAAGTVLPLTATVVPAATAHDETAVPHPVKKEIRIIKMKGNGKTGDVEVRDGAHGKVTKVERDGKTFVFRTDKKLSEEEVEKMIDDAEASREAADEASVEADEARGEAEAAHSEAEAAWGNAETMRVNAEAARGHAEAMRVHAVALAANRPRISVRLTSAKVGYPMTETAYLAIRNSATSMIDEKLLLDRTLSALNATRKNFRADKGHPDKHDREILEALDREIGHLKEKINRI